MKVDCKPTLKVKNAKISEGDLSLLTYPIMFKSISLDLVSPMSFSSDELDHDFHSIITPKQSLLQN